MLTDLRLSFAVHAAHVIDKRAMCRVIPLHTAVHAHEYLKRMKLEI
jgi:hypothetical protein